MLYHTNALTDQIIANFEDLHHSSDDDSIQPNVNNCGWWVEPPESSEDAPHSSTDAPDTIEDLHDSDDLDEKTDTEDDGDDVIELLKANMQLLTFLTKQSATIARFRGRIVRLGTVVMDLKVRLNNITQAHAEANRPSVTNLDLATVLVDTHLDTSFLVKPNCESQVDLRIFDHPKIQAQLTMQLAKIKKQMNCGCTSTRALRARSSCPHLISVNTFKQLDLLTVLAQLATGHPYTIWKKGM